MAAGTAGAAAARGAGGFGAFLGFALRLAATGGRAYWSWLGALLLVAGAGLAAYARQLQTGLAVTHLSDQVNWGLYISNFMFLGGVAASAMIFVIAVSLYGREELRPAIPLGVSLALASVVMGMLFVQADQGRPDRLWHLLPVVGILYLPHSLLAWDVLALNVYFILSLALAILLPYRRFRGDPRGASVLNGWVGLVAIAALLFLLVVEAFLFSGFTARPLWNTAMLVPRFVASAFVAGPALLVLMLRAVERWAGLPELSGARGMLTNVLRLAVPANLLMLAAEAFVHFYHPGAETASARYLFFGLDGQSRLVAWNWLGVALGLLAMAGLFLPALRARPLGLNLACACAAAEVWIEKGMGLIWAGFVPSPLGEVVEYLPSRDEILISLGIVSLGLILFTIAVKIGGAPEGGDAPAPPSRPARS